MAQKVQVAADYLKVYLSFGEGVGSRRTDGTVTSNSSLSMSPEQWHPCQNLTSTAAHAN